MPAVRFLELLKPYLWLALAGFLTGFLCYAGLGAPSALAKGRPAPVGAGPMSADWNLPKHV